MNNSLKFQTLKFRESINTTIRKGHKCLDLSKDLDILDASGNYIGDGQLIKVEYKPLCELDDMDILMEHDPLLRNYPALVKAMKSFYPDFEQKDLVSVIYFTIDVCLNNIWK